MRRTALYLAIVALCPVVALVAWRLAPSHAQPIPIPGGEPVSKRIPLTRVTLFNTGLGYFHREGEVTGEARLHLTFPAESINDMLKTIKIDDGGKPGVVSYDGPDQTEQGLRAFAIDLAGNPTFGQLVNQARGARVEVTLDSSGTSQPMSGTIVGMESSFEGATTEVHHLNILGPDGMRRLPLQRIQRLRFLDPVLEEEFRRALGVLAGGQSGQRRSVTLHLRGDGKRLVKIGHVAEAPIWKPSYRLTLDERPGKSLLQGWVVVQNTTEEDWKDIALTLVSGRPISFEMNLAQPLFVPRPTVEPQVYASLRPPEHELGRPNMIQGGIQLGGFGGQIGGPASGAGALGAAGHPPVGLGIAGGMVTSIGPGALMNRYQVPTLAHGDSGRLTWETLRERQKENLEAKKKPAAVDPNAVDERLEGIALDADRIGEGFRHTLPDRLSLTRQKSALVPVVHQMVTLDRYSLFDPRVHPRFPLHAARLKNVTEMQLRQGPLAVFDEGSYLGDGQVPDLAPGQECVVSFAMDLGLEVRREPTTEEQMLERVEIAKGHFHRHVRHVESTPYQMRNRSREVRTLMVEHPLKPGWELVGKDKLVQATEAAYRIAWRVPAGNSPRETIALQRKAHEMEPLATMTDDRLREALRLEIASKEVKAALDKMLEYREKLTKLREERTATQGRLDRLSQEQGQLRQRLQTMPAGTPPHKRLLAQFEKQEPELEQMQKQLLEQHVAESKLKAESDSYLLSLAVK
ncbi:MAG: hypothetical protein U0840_15500 [Gemmataceae bacterium]